MNAMSLTLTSAVRRHRADAPKPPGAVEAPMLRGRAAYVRSTMYRCESMST